MKKRARRYRRGLNEAGYVEDRNVAIEYRWAAGDLRPITSTGNRSGSPSGGRDHCHPERSAATRCQAATATIPIVFSIGGDPVKLGLVSSLNRPGGNVTGTSFLYNTLAPKRLELLHELVPNAAVIGLLVNPKNPASQVRDKRRASGSARVGAAYSCSEREHQHDIDASFTRFVQSGSTRSPSPPMHFYSHHNQLIALAVRHAVPAMYLRARSRLRAG